MKKRTDRMEAIMERIFSQEIARQEQWSKEDVEMFGEHMNREALIQEIKDFMEANNIRFSMDWYMRDRA